jgi:hypothetical protein
MNRGEFTETEYAKLPKWAQKKVDWLLLRVREAEREAEEARLATEPSLSNTLFKPYADIPIGLGKGETVRFMLAGDRRENYVDCRVDEFGRLQLNGHRTIHIIPQASNAAKIQFGDD